MTVKEYFDLKGWGVKDCHQVFLMQAKLHGSREKHDLEFRYRNTPIWSVWEWREWYEQGSDTLNSIVLNTKAYAHEWLSGTGWNWKIDRGQLTGLLVVSKDDFEAYYPGEQGRRLIEYIDRAILAELKR